MSGAFVFGGVHLRDKPVLVTIDTKDHGPVVYDITDDFGLMFNPGEPIIRIQTFYAPGDEVGNATVNADRRVRVLEVIPWEQVTSVAFRYLKVEDVDPSVWQKVMLPQMRPTSPNVN